MSAKKMSRRAAIRQFTREQEADWLQRRKISLLLGHAEELARIEEQRMRWRAELEASRAAVAELAERRAAGEVVTLH